MIGGLVLDQYQLHKQARQSVFEALATLLDTVLIAEHRKVYFTDDASTQLIRKTGSSKHMHTLKLSLLASSEPRCKISRSGHVAPINLTFSQDGPR